VRASPPLILFTPSSPVYGRSCLVFGFLAFLRSLLVQKSPRVLASRSPSLVKCRRFHSRTTMTTFFISNAFFLWEFGLSRCQGAFPRFPFFMKMASFTVFGGFPPPYVFLFHRLLGVFPRLRTLLQPTLFSNEI